MPLSLTRHFISGLLGVIQMHKSKPKMNIKKSTVESFPIKATIGNFKQHTQTINIIQFLSKKL